MRSLIVAVALVAFGFFTSAQATGCTYTSSGSPDLTHFTPGHTTFDQVQGDLGNPVQMTADSAGQPSMASFYEPMQGDAPMGAATGAANMAKGSMVSTVSSHAGSFLSHIPGIGGLVAAGAVDVGTAQAAGAVTGAGQKVWSCMVTFSHGVYQSGSCTTINRPVGA